MPLIRIPLLSVHKQLIPVYVGKIIVPVLVMIIAFALPDPLPIPTSKIAPVIQILYTPIAVDPVEMAIVLSPKDVELAHIACVLSPKAVANLQYAIFPSQSAIDASP